jgi:membrane protein insertase, YidC/Oxa1 family, C-terminal domain
MSWLMEPIYNTISWILLRWHDLWSLLLPGEGRFLGTNWEWVLAIVFLVVTVRVVLFPIFVKQIKSQRAMQALAPKVRELQAKYKGDPATLREEMMKLYQQEKVNPLMGCLPMLLQIPVFFGLFHVLRWIDASDKAMDYGWTRELFDSAAQAQLFTAPIPAAFSYDAARIAALGGAHPAAAKIVAAVLVLIMMFTTFMSSRQMILKTGWQVEPQQRMIQKLMLYGIPLSLLLSGWAFPIGVIIYWVTQNLISLGQQQWVLRKYPPIVTTPEPKTARERAEAAAKARGPIARFFLVLPPPPKPAGAETTKRGWLAKLGRRPAAVPAEPVQPAARALAPRPGAKPRPVTSGSTGAATSARSADESAPAKAAPTKGTAAKAAPTKTPPTRTTPTKATAKTSPAKAASAQAADTTVAPAETPNGGGPGISVGRTPTVGRMPTVGTTTSSAKPPTNEASPNGATVRSGGARSGGGGRTGGGRKAAQRRKGGQPARKGGGKR